MLQINISWYAKYVDRATHEIHEIKCPMNNNDFTVVYKEIGTRETGSNTRLPETGSNTRLPETGSNTRLPRRLMHYVFLKIVPLMNSFNKTDAAIFACRLSFLVLSLFLKLIELKPLNRNNT